MSMLQRIGFVICLGLYHIHIPYAISNAISICLCPVCPIVCVSQYEYRYWAVYLYNIKL